MDKKRKIEKEEKSYKDNGYIELTRNDYSGDDTYYYDKEKQKKKAKKERRKNNDNNPISYF